MGRIKQIIKTETIQEPMFNNRFTVELCENIHVHYRNVRLEFSKEEFTQLLKLLKGLDENKINNFEYGEGKFEPLIHTETLPNETFFNNRLQIEEQVEGHFHIHYKNLRIELKDLKEFGYE